VTTYLSTRHSACAERLSPIFFTRVPRTSNSRFCWHCGIFESHKIRCVSDCIPLELTKFGNYIVLNSAFACELASWPNVALCASACPCLCLVHMSYRYLWAVQLLSSNLQYKRWNKVSYIKLATLTTGCPEAKEDVHSSPEADDATENFRDVVRSSSDQSTCLPVEFDQLSIFRTAMRNQNYDLERWFNLGR